MKQFKSYLNKTQFQGLTVSTKHSWIFFTLSEFHNGQVHQVLEENRNPWGRFLLSSSIQKATFNPSCCIYFKGPVQFTSKGDRMGYMKIEQLQG